MYIHSANMSGSNQVLQAQGGKKRTDMKTYHEVWVLKLPLSPGFLQIWRCNLTPVRQESCNFPCSTGKTRHQTTRMWTSREDAQQNHQGSLSLFPSVEKNVWRSHGVPRTTVVLAIFQLTNRPKKKSLISGAYILMGSHRKPPNQVSKIHSIWDADKLLEEKYLRMNEV